MPTDWDIIVSWDATPAELRAVGAALWRWCTCTEAGRDVFQRLDSQALADLIAGVFPRADRTQRPVDGWGVHFSVRGGAGLDHQETIASLQRELPRAGIADVLIDGTSWHRVAAVEAPDALEPDVDRTPVFS